MIRRPTCPCSPAASSKARKSVTGFCGTSAALSLICSLRTTMGSRPNISTSTASAFTPKRWAPGAPTTGDGLLNKSELDVPMGEFWVPYPGTKDTPYASGGCYRSRIGGAHLRQAVRRHRVVHDCASQSCVGVTVLPEAAGRQGDVAGHQPLRFSHLGPTAVRR